MGARERQVGGGAAGPVAQNWNQFLNQQLTGQNPEQQQLQQRIQQLTQMQQSLRGRPGVNTGAIDAELARMQGQLNGGGQMSNGQGIVSNGMMSIGGGAPQMTPVQGGQQGGTAFQNLFNQAASGQINDPSGAFAQLQAMIAGGGNASPQYANPYQSQTYVNPNVSQLSTDLFSGQTGMADLSGVRGVQDTNVDVMRGFGGQSGGTQFDSSLQSLIQQMQGGGSSVGSQATSLDPARQVDLNDPLVRAQQEGVQRAKMVDIANTRARFGAEGAGAMGTGAQVAEGTLAAEYAPREAAILQDAIRFQQQQDLQERQAKAGVGLQSNAQALQAGMANAGNNLQSSQGALQALLSGRGQDLQQLIANRGLDVNQMGLALNQAQGNQGAGLTARGQDLSSILQNQGQGNQFNLAATGMNQGNAQLNNTNALTAANQQNGFNLSQAATQGQLGLGTNQLNAGQGQFDQNQLMQMIQMGLGQNNASQGMQAQLLQMLFGGMQQSNGLGTPQAQSVMQQNPWMQALQAGMGLGGAYLNRGN